MITLLFPGDRIVHYFQIHYSILILIGEIIFTLISFPVTFLDTESIDGQHTFGKFLDVEYAIL